MFFFRSQGNVHYTFKLEIYDVVLINTTLTC